jgi:hypothetical protein
VLILIAQVKVGIINRQLNIENKQEIVGFLCLTPTDFCRFLRISLSL